MLLSCLHAIIGAFQSKRSYHTCAALLDDCSSQYAELCTGAQLSCTTEEIDTVRPYKRAGKLQERTDVALMAVMLSHVKQQCCHVQGSSAVACTAAMLSHVRQQCCHM